ncbi:hypothetical protein [Rubripirellula tenax]|nr:hypothetical protein [Rubripirellula tenax]
MSTIKYAIRLRIHEIGRGTSGFTGSGVLMFHLKTAASPTPVQSMVIRDHVLRGGPPAGMGRASGKQRRNVAGMNPARGKQRRDAANLDRALAS